MLGYILSEGNVWSPLMPTLWDGVSEDLTLEICKYSSQAHSFGRQIQVPSELTGGRDVSKTVGACCLDIHEYLYEGTGI